MVAKRFELLHLSIPEYSQLLLVKKLILLESGALDRSAKQPIRRFVTYVVELINLKLIMYIKAVNLSMSFRVWTLVYTLPSENGENKLGQIKWKNNTSHVFRNKTKSHGSNFERSRVRSRKKKRDSKENFARKVFREKQKVTNKK